jgi:predicted N-acetyltransferase YhbS
MESKHIVIRRETEADHRAVEQLVRESFWNVYRPGCYEHFVLHRLRSDPAFVPELDLVMEQDGQLIGQNMFMRAAICLDGGGLLDIMTMGPICIAPEKQRRGYGKLLLDESLERAGALGCGALCFEGNILFYGKSGFTYAREFGIRYHDLPEGADDSFFLCRELIPGYLKGIRGVYGPPEGYFAADREPEAFAAFDALFPPKEKKVLPGQLGSGGSNQAAQERENGSK